MVVATGDSCVGHDLYASGQRSGFEACGLVSIGVGTPTQVSPNRVVMLDQEHRGAGLGSCRSGSETRWTGSGNDDIRVGVPLVEVERLALMIDGAAGSKRSQHLLIGRPKKLRPHERLVVEAWCQKPTNEAVGGLHVALERGPHVLGADVHAVRSLAVAGANVWFVADLHETVRIPVVGGEQAALAVVLHASRNELMP